MTVKRIEVDVTAVPSTAAAAYTVPNTSGKEKAEIVQIGVHSRTDAGGDYEVILYRVPSGGSATTATEVYARTLAEGRSDVPFKLLNATLEAGTAIYAYCATADKINLDMSVREITE